MSTPLLPGDPDRLGDYELLGRLGAGGMGTVYLGRGRDGRRVAVKTVRTEYAWDSQLRGRFRSEVNRLREVPPFCTAAVLDADPEHEPPYLVVEYVSGPSLADEIRDNGPLGPDLLHSVVTGFTAALAAIHGAGVVHRDLKPNNILISLGSVKVIDFGIARPLDLTSEHTLTGHTVGTIEYMAPERVDTTAGHPVGQAADIFAWGSVVAYAATGRTPFAAHSAPAIAVRIASEPPDLAGLDCQLRDLVERALRKQPGDRPTARELLDALLGLAAPIGRRPAADPVPPRPAPLAPVISAPRAVPDREAAVESRRYSRAFVVLMVLTGLLGTILTTTLYLFAEDWINNIGPPTSSSAPTDTP